MALLIQDYKNANRIFRAAIEREFDLLLIHGRGGTGKTEIMMNALKEKNVTYHYIRGYTTRTQFIRELFEHRDELIVIDDVDNILRDRLLVGILKQACETTREKTIHYHSTAYQLADIPQTFTIRSNLVLILNDLGKLNKDVQAFLTRGMEIHFEPTNKEVLGYLRGWAEKGEVLSFLEEIAWQVKDFNVRMYKLAMSLYHSKETKPVWKQLMIGNLQVDPARILAYRITKNGGNYQQRVKKFITATGLTERTYARYLEDLVSEGLVKKNAQYGRKRYEAL